MNNKACYICGSFEHLHANCDYHVGRREVFGNKRVESNKFQNKSHPNSHSNMIPRAVQLRSGLKSFSTARTFNTAHPKTSISSAKPKTIFVKSAQTGKMTFSNKKGLL